MIITEIIEKKRDGQVLKPEEIDFMINGLVNGEVADYQNDFIHDGGLLPWHERNRDCRFDKGND